MTVTVWQTVFSLQIHWFFLYLSLCLAVSVSLHVHGCGCLSFSCRYTLFWHFPLSLSPKCIAPAAIPQHNVVTSDSLATLKIISNPLLRSTNTTAGAAFDSDIPDPSRTDYHLQINQPYSSSTPSANLIDGFGKELMLSKSEYLTLNEVLGLQACQVSNLLEYIGTITGN